MASTALEQVIKILPSITGGKSLPEMQGKYVRNKVLYSSVMAQNLVSRRGRAIQESDVKSIGTTNFQFGNTIQKGTFYVVKGIRIMADTTASITVNTALWKSASPATLINGETTISQSGQGTLFENPTSILVNDYAAVGNASDFVEIVPFVLRPDAKFEIIVQLNGTVATDYAIRVELDCFEILDKEIA